MPAPQAHLIAACEVAYLYTGTWGLGERNIKRDSSRAAMGTGDWGVSYADMCRVLYMFFFFKAFLFDSVSC